MNQNFGTQFWKDSNEKYLNRGAKYRLNIHKLNFDIIWVKICIKFCNRKILKFLLFLFKSGKKIRTKISRRFKSSHMNTSLTTWTLVQPSEYKSMWRWFQLVSFCKMSSSWVSTCRMSWPLCCSFVWWVVSSKLGTFKLTSLLFPVKKQAGLMLLDCKGSGVVFTTLYFVYITYEWPNKLSVCLRQALPASCNAKIDIESLQNRLLKVCYVPTTSAGFNRHLFFLFLQWPLIVLMKQTRQAVRAIKQSIYLDVYECNTQLN